MSKGFILGTVPSNSVGLEGLSVSANPKVHTTRDLAITEAKRLLNNGGIPSGRKAIVLEHINNVKTVSIVVD